MPQPQNKSPKKKLAELPDEEAIRKLFPAKVVKKVDREIDHQPAKKPAKKK